MHLSITACYCFSPIREEDLESLKTELKQFGELHQMRGLVLIATEGINGTVSGSVEAIAAWKNSLTQRFGAITFKDSTADREVFKRWSVKIKEEIVALKENAIQPSGRHQHLSPAEWKQKMQEENVIVLDARNDYEVAIGKFAGAIDPQLKTFQEFPQYIDRANIPKDKTVLLYCTGGIRCEKALLSMEKRGYQHVYQLDGGILAYLEQFPNDTFEGECFVFDHRAAVDQELKPSATYRLCPHCGDPGDRMIDCRHCNIPTTVCKTCAEDPSALTCSKRCRQSLKKVSV